MSLARRLLSICQSSVKSELDVIYVEDDTVERVAQAFHGVGAKLSKDRVRQLVRGHRSENGVNISAVKDIVGAKNIHMSEEEWAFIIAELARVATPVVAPAPPLSVPVPAPSVPAPRLSMPGPQCNEVSSPLGPSPECSSAANSSSSDALIRSNRRLVAQNRSMRIRYRIGLKSLRRKIQQKDSKIKKQSLVITKLKGDLATFQFHRGSKKRYFTNRGGLTLAVRRCISGSGSAGIGMALGMDISGKSIRTWEVISFVLVFLVVESLRTILTRHGYQASIKSRSGVCVDGQRVSKGCAKGGQVSRACSKGTYVRKHSLCEWFGFNLVFVLG